MVCKNKWLLSGFLSLLLLVGLLVPVTSAHSSSVPLGDFHQIDSDYIEVEVTPYSGSKNPTLQRFDISNLKGLKKMSESQAMSFTRAKGYDGGPHEFKEAYLGRYIDKSLFNIYHITDKINRGDVYILDKNLRGIKANEKY